MNLRRTLFGPTRREREEEAAVELICAVMEVAAVAIKAGAAISIAEIEAANKRERSVPDANTEGA